MTTKTHIPLELSSLDRALERTAVVILVTMWALSLYMLFTLPQTIPTHYNFSGEPDRYGNKTMLLVLPMIGSGQFFLLTWLNKHPHLFNYPVKITQENAERQYLLATRMMRIVKLLVLLMFTVILLLTHLTTLGHVKGLGRWFLLIAIGIFLIPVIIMVIKTFRAK